MYKWLDKIKKFFTNKENIVSIIVLAILGIISLYFIAKYAWLIALLAILVWHIYDSHNEQQQQQVNQQQVQQAYNWQMLANNVILPIQIQIYGNSNLAIGNLVLVNGAIPRGYGYQLQSVHNRQQQQRIRRLILFELARQYNTNIQQILKNATVTVYRDWIDIII